MNTSRLDATLHTQIHVIRREREGRSATLELFDGEGSPQVFPLSDKELAIGRSPDAQIRVPSQRASRIHAYLDRKGPDFILRDNDSHNGIFLNGVRIHSATLRDGDVIQIADNAFVFREV